MSEAVYICMHTYIHTNTHITCEWGKNLLELPARSESGRGNLPTRPCYELEIGISSPEQTQLVTGHTAQPADCKLDFSTTHTLSKRPLCRTQGHNPKRWPCSGYSLSSASIEKLNRFKQHARSGSKGTGGADGESIFYGQNQEPLGSKQKCCQAQLPTSEHPLGLGKIITCKRT